jgi:ABC-type Fe3+ transport system permease subunit
MTLDSKRWAQLASELKFSQLDIARKQAEVWRAGLAALTALLTAIFILKGRDNVSDLTEPYQEIVVGLLGLALLLLLLATMWVSRALAGPPGQEILLTGEEVEKWTRGEVRKISTALRWAPTMAAVGVVAVAAAIAVTWLAPAQGTSNPLVQVTESTGHQACGQLIGVSDHELIVQPAAGPTLIPLTAVTAITPVTTCP